MSTDQLDTNPRWYTIKEAAEYLGVTEPTIYRWMRDGQMTYRKIGDSTRFLQADLDNHVQVYRSAKDIEQVKEHCPVCHHTELIPGDVRSTGMNYFYPENTKFWTLKASHIETQARMCARCGVILWFGEPDKLAALKKTTPTSVAPTEPSEDTEK